jgi:hypothetical protein
LSPPIAGTPTAPTPTPPLIRPATPPPGGTPYWVLPSGGVLAAGAIAIAGAVYAYWEWSTYLQGDDFEANFGALKDRTKGINRFRLNPGRKCSDYNPLFQYFHLNRAVKIMAEDWRQQQTQRSPKEDQKTVMAGVWCLDTANGSVVGTLWSLSGTNGGLNALPQKNNYNQPGLFEHSAAFRNSLVNPNQGAYHAEMNAIGRLVDEGLLTSQSTGFVLLLGANQSGSICPYCRDENLPGLVKRFPNVNFDVKVDRYSDLAYDRYVHSFYTDGRRWFINDRSNAANNTRGTR